MCVQGVFPPLHCLLRPLAYSELLKGLPREFALHVPCALQLCRERKPWYLLSLALLQISGLRRDLRYYDRH